MINPIEIITGIINSAKINVGIADDDIVNLSKERLEICFEKCEPKAPKFLEAIKLDRTYRCPECGCFLDFKSTTISSNCPLNYWKK
jgi:hypothetical protein